MQQKKEGYNLIFLIILTQLYFWTSLIVPYTEKYIYLIKNIGSIETIDKGKVSFSENIDNIKKIGENNLYIYGVNTYFNNEQEHIKEYFTINKQNGNECFYSSKEEMEKIIGQTNYEDAYIFLMKNVSKVYQ